MWGNRLELVEPTLQHAPSLAAMVEDYRRAGERRYHDLPTIGAIDARTYVERLTQRALNLDPKPTQSPQYTYWLMRGETILGASRLRETLTPALQVWGGHISYDIRPSERRKGYGTQLLALTLDKARDLGLSRVRLMCYHDNVASASIIERNGGELIYDGPCALAGGNIFTYEIAL
jgi:predicted acetyltransferase